MKKLNHTPGPWVNGYGPGISGDRASWEVYTDGKCKHKVISHKSDSNDYNESICTINYSADEERAVADARLIAAAPEMEKALICRKALSLPYNKGVSILVSYGFDESDRFELSASQFVEKLEETAIQKATGYTWEELTKGDE